MQTTSLTDVRKKFSECVEDVMTTHERDAITRNGKTAAVLISAEDLEALEETLLRAGQGRVDKHGPTVGVDAVLTGVLAGQVRDQH